MRRTPLGLGGLFLTLALAVPAPGQILGMGEDPPPSPTPTPAAGRQEPRASIVDGTAFPEPELEFVRETGARHQGLEPLLDTATIRNEPIPGMAPGGFCYGLLRVQAMWYTRIIRPAAGRGADEPVVTSTGDEVHSGNFREFRMRRRTTRDPGFRRRVALSA